MTKCTGACTFLMNVANHASLSPTWTIHIHTFVQHPAHRLQMLDASVKAREDAAAFDTSRLVEFSERLLWEGPVLGLSPLVREPGRLAITDQRVYFQPLHNISGAVDVRSTEHSLELHSRRFVVWLDMVLISWQSKSGR